jgi:hypothetical protein
MRIKRLVTGATVSALVFGLAATSEAMPIQTLKGPDSYIHKTVFVHGGHAGGFHGGGYHGGGFHGGGWHGGAYHAGGWHGGAYHAGAWHGGAWHGGAWHAGGWARPGGYWWPVGGAIAAGAAIGFVGAATAASWAGAPPGPGLCWYYTDPSRTNGFWDACQ